MKRNIFITGVMLTGLITSLYSGKIVQFNFSPTNLSFPALDPDQHPNIPAVSDLQISFFINQIDETENWTLDIFAADDMISGGDRIPIENISWQVTGTVDPPGTLVNGILNRGVYVNMGQGPGNSKNRHVRGTLHVSFFLRNLWTYPAGNYSQQVSLRLTAPGDVQYETFTIIFNPQPLVKLEFAGTAVTFADANPDLFPILAAQENPLPSTVKARIPTAQPLYLRSQSGGELVSGADTILINNITWSATGPGFISGTLSRLSPQVTGTWTGPGEWSGTLSFSLANDWSYNVGNYSATVTYTLSTI